MDRIKPQRLDPSKSYNSESANPAGPAGGKPLGKLGLLRRITKRERHPPVEPEVPVGNHIVQPVAQEGAGRRTASLPTSMYPLDT